MQDEPEDRKAAPEQRHPPSDDRLTDGDHMLRSVAARRDGRSIPRLGWPTGLLPPRHVHVDAVEGPGSVTVLLRFGASEAAARLDLQTREVAVSASGGSAARRAGLRRLAVAYTDDRNDFDGRNGVDLHPRPPVFSAEDPNTWSDMQLFAAVTDSDWYPPVPGANDPAGRSAALRDAARFNDRPVHRGAAATTPQPAPPQGAQPSADPATLDPSAPAAE